MLSENEVQLILDSLEHFDTWKKHEAEKYDEMAQELLGKDGLAVRLARAFGVDMDDDNREAMDIKLAEFRLSAHRAAVVREDITLLRAKLTIAKRNAAINDLIQVQQ